MNVQDYVWPLKLLQELSVVTYFSSWRGSKKSEEKKNTPTFKSCRASHFVCCFSSCLWYSQCLSKHDETWDQQGASNDLSLSQGSSLSRRSTQNKFDIEQGTVHVSDTICLWRGPMLHVKSDEKKQREGKEERAKEIFNGKEAIGGKGKFLLSLALLYITLNCDTCKRQHYQLEAMSDCQFVIHFNNCHGPVRN